MIFYFVPFWQKNNPKLYLSNTPSSFKELTKQSSNNDSVVLDIGEPIYVYFTMNKKIGHKDLEFTILDLSNADAGVEIGSVRYSINPSWTKLQTQFQEDYFSREGEYKITVSIPGREEAIIEKSFSVH